MIYIFEFLKGASWALLLFGAFFIFFAFTYFYLFIFVIAVLLNLVAILFLQNFEFKAKLKHEINK